MKSVKGRNNRHVNEGAGHATRFEGWVERSETHRDLVRWGTGMGFASAL